MLLDAQAAQLNAHDAAVPQGEPLEFRYVDDVAYLDPVVFPDPPLRLRHGWPVPVQMSLVEIERVRSGRGGPESALFLLPPAGGDDFYETPSGGRSTVVVRWHIGPRRRMFSPVRTNSAYELRVFTGRRRTLLMYADMETQIVDDNWRVTGAGQAYLDRQWRGRTELEIDLNLLNPRSRADLIQRADEQRRQLRTGL